MKKNNLHVTFEDSRCANILFGPLNSNLKFMSELTGLSITSFGNDLIIGSKSKSTTEKDMTTVADTFEHCYNLIIDGQTVDTYTLDRIYKSLSILPGENIQTTLIQNDAIKIKTPKLILNPRNASQKRYIEFLEDNEVVFGIGPAGTGKTYIAVAMAVQMLMEKKIKKIILTRPAVEAGEKLGFLPGTMEDKIDPYLRPLFDALEDMLGRDFANNRIYQNCIEIAPLAFMRGRTLSDAFLILDEAQNTTPEQMKMFLTRMGFNSRMVVTGDISQIDLPPSLVYSEENKNNRWLPKEVRSGLIESVELLANVKGIGIHEFHEDDIVRHPLVNKIVKAYNKQK